MKNLLKLLGKKIVDLCIVTPEARVIRAICKTITKGTTFELASLRTDIKYKIYLLLYGLFLKNNHPLTEDERQKLKEWISKFGLQSEFFIFDPAFQFQIKVESGLSDFTNCEEDIRLVLKEVFEREHALGNPAPCIWPLYWYKKQRISKRLPREFVVQTYENTQKRMLGEYSLLQDAGMARIREEYSYYEALLCFKHIALSGQADNPELSYTVYLSPHEEKLRLMMSRQGRQLNFRVGTYKEGSPESVFPGMIYCFKPIGDVE